VKTKRAPGEEHPVDIEKRTRSWPISVTPILTFEQRDAVEKELKESGHETASFSWGGQWLEVRARPIKT